MEHFFKKEIFFIFLLLGIIDSTTGQNSLCVSFDQNPFNPNSDWINIEHDLWDWSNSAYPPDITNIPSFYYESGYVWFQDQTTPPKSATMQMSAFYTLNRGDVVTATIYKYLIYNSTNDTFRPVLRFHTDDDTVDLLYSGSTELWDTVTETCGYAIECCKSDRYPCSGQFQLNGEVMIRDELLAVDQIEINAGCGYKPSPFCCNFDNSLCNWNLVPDWTWSINMVVPEFSPPPLHTNYVWATLSEPQSSATLPTPLISGVDFNSTVTFRYYFFATGKDSSLVFLFDKLHVYTLSDSHLDWQTYTVGCKHACNNGTLQVEIICENALGNSICAIDGFTIDDTCEIDT